MAKRKSPGVRIAEEVQPAFDEIAGLVDGFCKQHLNAEYADLCRRLAEKLARKRPSPLVSGKPNTWACGIVRTIGWVNFLADKNQRVGVSDLRTLQRCGYRDETKPTDRDGNGSLTVACTNAWN
jgi:hypothetical protein